MSLWVRWEGDRSNKDGCGRTALAFMELHYHAEKAQRCRARAHAEIWMESSLIASLQDMELNQAINSHISTVDTASFRLQIHHFIACLPLDADITTPQIT